MSPQGVILPVKAQRDINATLNAQTFGGGIRYAGSNSRDAILVMDGDLATGWSPDPQDSAENWTIEVDLGRGVSARRVKLIFDPEGPVPELFALLMSTTPSTGRSSTARANASKRIPDTKLPTSSTSPSTPRSNTYGWTF